jgi:ABC-type branched-subunit amino acid transport system substrate-binding protein
MNIRYKKFYVSILFLFLSSITQAGTIELGMSTTLSGPNQNLGRAMYQGMQAFFDETNQQGGINGQKIHFTVLDDGYEPASVLENIKKLIDQHKVIAIVGNVGTPTAAVAAPKANSRGVVFYGAFTGADILRRTPPEPYIFNFRASYRQEMEMIVRNIIDHGISPHRIAFFLQDDSLGQTGFDMAKAALEKFGFQQTDELLITRYQRNSLSIQNAIVDMIRSKPEPEAIILVGAYQPIAQFIRFSHRIFPQTRFYNLSFSGAPILADALEGIYGRIYMAQVVPPITSIAPDADANSETANAQNSIWREGYFAAKVLVTALNSIQGEISSHSLKTALEAMGTFNLEDFGVLSFGPSDHQASDHIWLTHLNKMLEWEVVKANGETH